MEHTRPRSTGALSLALSVLVLLTACGTEDPGAPSEGDPPEVVVSWSQGGPDADEAWLHAHTTPRLIGSDAERKQFLDGLPEQYVDDAAPLNGVDLSVDTLVVAGFSQCGNVGEVTVADGEVFHAVRQVEKIECVWAPTKVEVFRVSGTSLTLGSP